MELSESTPSRTQHQNILVNAQGDPFKINLQAVELEGRPKLVRILKNSGALVVSNAKEAAIILVDSTTESGKRLIRTWGHDASKVVLECRWARASVNAGRPLLGADNWGGAMTVDDGKPVTIDGVVVDEDELEEVEALVTKSPLPTPRVTPVDPASQQPANAVAGHSDTARSEFSITRPARPTVADTTPLVPMTDIHDIPPTQNPPSPPAIQPLTYFQPSLFVQPSQSQNNLAYAPLAIQQSSQPQMIPAQPFPHSSFSSSQPHQPHMVHTSGVPRTSLPSVQSPMMQMSSNTPPVNGVNLQTTGLAAIMTIMDVVRHMDQSSWLGQNRLPVPQLPTNSNTPTFPEQPITPSHTPSTSTIPSTKESESPRSSLRDVTSTSRGHGSGTDISEHHSMTRESRIKPSHRTLDEILTPSVSRKRPPAVKPTNPPPKRLRKGKYRAISIDSSEHSEASDNSHSTRSSASPARNIIARRKYGEIFLSDSGQPLRFFVQVDLHGRHTVVTNIKKNKGKIVNNIADADYSILFARSDTFQGLLNEAVALGKSPIIAAFVADCIEEGALLDETDYIVDSVARIKALKRGRQNAFSVKVETVETIAYQPKAVKPTSSLASSEDKRPRETLINKKSKQVTKSTATECATEDRANSSRSPTPPTTTTRLQMKSGRYMFTEVEDEYVLRLAKHHLTRDPTISNTALVNKLHKKMPHHTAASWAGHIDKKLKWALEDVRKRANIAKRKRDSGTANQNPLLQGVVHEGASSKGPVLGSAQMNEDMLSNPDEPSQEDLERQDFDVITRFFASGGGGDDDDDERVWQELEKHRQCRSASSWPDYYAAHQEQVYARIEELTKDARD